MRLAARIALAEAPRERRETVLAPRDLLRDVLEDHELVVHTGCTVAEVHAALVALHERHRAREEAAEAVPPPPPGRRRCPHCECGFEVLDAREGCVVCDSCGAVLTLRSINVEPEYVAPVEDLRNPGTSIPGVSSWLVQQMRAPETPTHSTYWAELEHWNQFVHIGDEELRGMDRSLRTWTDGGHTRVARMVATMLYPLMRERLPDAALIRERLRCGEALPVVETLEPPRRFACPGCGDLRHTAKDARFHCRHGFGKRKR